MAKWANDDMMDAMLYWVSQNATKLTLCTAQPTTYTAAVTLYVSGSGTYMLAEVALTSASFTLADGDTSGRKITVAAQTGLTVTATGTCTHVALVSSGDTTLRYVDTTTSQLLTGGNLVDTPAWDIEVRDPT